MRPSVRSCRVVLVVYTISISVLYGLANGMPAGGAVVLAIWTLSPAAGGFWIVKPGNAANSSVVALGLVLVFGSAMYVYANALYLRPDPQSGLGVVYMPLVQWLCVLLLYWLTLPEKRS